MTETIDEEARALDALEVLHTFAMRDNYGDRHNAEMDAHMRAISAALTRAGEADDLGDKLQAEVDHFARIVEGAQAQISALTEERDAALRRVSELEGADFCSQVTEIADHFSCDRDAGSILFQVTELQADFEKLKAERDALTAQLEQARAALKPFGDEAMLWADHGADTKVYTITGKGMSVEDVEMCIVADLRRAASIAKGEG